MNFRIGKKENPKRVIKLPVADSIELSKYILAYCGTMNQMKLQKLLYYLESYHLAYFQSSLVEDEFEAWMKGPISLKIWNYYKNLFLVFDPIKVPEASDGNREKIERLMTEKLTAEQLNVIHNVLNQLGNLTEYELEYLSCREQPYKMARTGYDTASICREVISKETMQKFYAGNISTR